MKDSKVIIFISVIVVMFIALGVYIFIKPADAPKEKREDKQVNTTTEATTENKDTYVYSKYGFSINLPKDFIPQEEKAKDSPAIIISLPTGSLSYVTDASYWEKYNIPSFTFVEDKMIGETNFKHYTFGGGKVNFYWYKNGNVGYSFAGTEKSEMDTLLKTFKFTGLF
jgi:hypothetical protein